MDWDFAAAKSAVDELGLDGPNLEVARQWLSLWRGDAGPARADFRLEALGANAPAAAIFEVANPASIICRQAGMWIGIGLGVPAANLNLLDVTPPEQRHERVRRILEVVNGAVLAGERMFLLESGAHKAVEINLPFADTGPRGERYYLMHSNWRPKSAPRFLSGAAGARAAIAQSVRSISIAKEGGPQWLARSVHQFGKPERPSLFFEDPQTVDEPTLFAMLQHWRRQRGDGQLPLWRSFNPKELKVHLPWLVVIDALPDYAEFRYRLVGTRVCEYFLANGTGKTVSEAFAGLDELTQGILRMYRHTCLSKRPTRATGPASRFQNVYFPAYDSLYLPYSDDGTTANRIVNVFSFNYDEIKARRTSATLTLRRHGGSPESPKVS